MMYNPSVAKIEITTFLNIELVKKSPAVSGPSVAAKSWIDLTARKNAANYQPTCFVSSVGEREMNRTYGHIYGDQPKSNKCHRISKLRSTFQMKHQYPSLLCFYEQKCTHPCGRFPNDSKKHIVNMPR